MKRRTQQIIKLFSVLALLGMCLYSCGGGGGDDSMGSFGGADIPAKTLSWAAPTAYTDGTPINTQKDLQSFEIYVHESSTFTEKDVPVASVAPTDRSFNLALLYPEISQGQTYYVSIRVVDTAGLVSDFSPPASFSL